MFVQVISGQVKDPAAVRSALERWEKELAPAATGWLGSTTGVTDDGTLLAFARFASGEDARRNSDRSEQGDWWAETSKLFTGEVTFHDSEDVEVDEFGDLDQAGFVQVIRGRVSDTERARELSKRDPELWARIRPDILGTMTVVHEGGDYTMVAYFTSEADARKGESTPPPTELASRGQELQGLNVKQPDFFDLRNPWLQSPSS